MRAHLALGFEATLPISCLSLRINEIDEVYIYVAEMGGDYEKVRVSQALNALTQYLRGLRKEYKVIRVNPCSNEFVKIFILSIVGRSNYICPSSGMRVFGILMVLLCLLVRADCTVTILTEGGGQCVTFNTRKLKVIEKEEIAEIYYYLLAKGEASVKEISDALSIKYKSVWEMIKNAESVGLIERTGRGRYKARGEILGSCKNQSFR